MKTVVDAVNYLNGDIELGVTAVYCGRILDFLVSTSLNPREDNFDVKFLDGINAQFSYDEFNQCVAEMTEGLFVPLSDLNKRKTEAVAETAEWEGNIYQLNSLYQTREGIKVVLDAVIDEGLKVSKLDSYSSWWAEQELFETSVVIGTITKAPLVLEDGTLVMFDCGSSTGSIGEVYTSVTNLKMINFVQNNRFVEADKCTNIIKLVPESK